MRERATSLRRRKNLVSRARPPAVLQAATTPARAANRRAACTAVKEAAQEGKITGKTFWQAVFEVASLIFVAEWGDRSMLATIALGAAQSPVGECRPRAALRAAFPAAEADDDLLEFIRAT